MKMTENNTFWSKTADQMTVSDSLKANVVITALGLVTVAVTIGVIGAATTIGDKIRNRKAVKALKPKK